MRNSPCYVVAVSALVFACSSSSSNGGPAGEGGAGGEDGAGEGGAGGEAGRAGATAGTTTSTNAGGSTRTSTNAAGSSGTAAAESSGLDGTRIVVNLSDADTATLCRWMEAVLGLVPGATADATYLSGTWFSPSCSAGDPVQLWGSPARCESDVSSGNAVGCPDLTVAKFESCMKAIRSDVCLLDPAPECVLFNTCYPQLVED